VHDPDKSADDNEIFNTLPILSCSSLEYQGLDVDQLNPSVENQFFSATGSLVHVCAAVKTEVSKLFLKITTCKSLSSLYLVAQTLDETFFLHFLGFV
jgi:hypothetical protein